MSHAIGGPLDAGADEEPEPVLVPLYETARERELLDEQANLYSLLLATEHLERAYARDAVAPEEYAAHCKKLISQFRLAERAVFGGSGSGSGGNSNNNNTAVEAFMERYGLDCPRARERLLRMGVPEPAVRGGGAAEAGHAAAVAEAVAHFITAMDAVRVEQRAVDELQPLLGDLMDALAQLPTPDDFEPSRKVRRWLEQLNAMRAVDNIDEEEARQLHHDLDSAYSEFTRYLKRGPA